MRDWLLFGKNWGKTDCLVATNAILEGAWITVSTDNPDYDERPYMVSDGNGRLTDIAAFNINTKDPGSYTVQVNGSVSLAINGSNGGSITANGRLIADTEMDLTYDVGSQATKVHCVKVPDRSYLAGVWEGTLVDHNQTDKYPIAFIVDASGVVVQQINGFPLPVTGAMFGTGNNMSAFFRTGATGEYNQFAVFGNQMYHNTIQTEYVTDSSSGGGTALLSRVGMWIGEIHYIEADVNVHCSNGLYYIQAYIGDQDHYLTGAYIEGPYGHVDLTYNSSPTHPGFWTSIQTQMEVPGIFPQTWTVTVTYGSGSTEMFDQIKTGCDDSN
jgi:hypothetical protein